MRPARHPAPAGCRSAAVTALASSMAIVIGPAPHGPSCGSLLFAVVPDLAQRPERPQFGQQQ